MPGADRRLAAIMLTDIVGYTCLSQAKESLALELLEDFSELKKDPGCAEFVAEGGLPSKFPQNA